ncbi:hypothetical protein QQ020_05050 [Fulvivirgaceae bacterium BMA12]|uniref:Lipoprotein n=1 Tax=Agaribacillus aureus TaxID=3051825 RepID=A0ABT8L0X9_9BACT|nr:hypothetical protein [Fulvivirgaceae bacterium BMA12]
MKNLLLGLSFMLLLIACNNQKQTKNSAEEPVEQVAATPETKEPNQGKALIKEMVKAVGGIEALKSLKDVEYEYIYDVPGEGKKDVSLERYIFDGEYSWAKYTTHTKWVMPDVEGEVEQGYNGKESWVTLNGKIVEDSAVVKIGDFLRKTNFYWFCMMFKQLDPGMTYEYKGTQTVDGVDYELVKVGFEAHVGDAQDTYVLYINPKTKLVDQFLFTVMDFGMTNPLLTKIEYQTVEGIKVPASRKYIVSDWEGTVKGEDWIENYYKDVKFNNGFTEVQFQKPGAEVGA